MKFNNFCQKIQEISRMLFRLEGANAEKTVNEVLQDVFLSKKVEFSKHDVTRAVRDRMGAYINVQHEVVRPLVEIAMQSRFDYEDSDNGSYHVYKPIVAKAIPSKPITSGQCVIGFNGATGVAEKLKQINASYNNINPVSTNINTRPVFTASPNKAALVVPRLAAKELECPVNVRIHGNYGAHKNITVNKDSRGDVRIPNRNLLGDLSKPFRIIIESSTTIIVTQ